MCACLSGKVNDVSKQNVVTKAVTSEARISALKAELQQVTGEVKDSKVKTPRYSGGKLIVEQVGMSLSIDVKWDKVDSAELDAKVHRTHKINRGTPENPEWIEVREKAMYEDNKRVWVDAEGKQYDSSMVHDFTAIDGKETETRPFEMTKQIRVLKEVPRAEIESEFLIEHQYEFFSSNMQGSLWKYGQHLRTAQTAAVCKIVLRKGYKDYNLLLVPIVRPDGQFVMLGFLVRERKKLKHWMPVNAQDSSSSEVDNPNTATASVIEEI